MISKQALMPLNGLTLLLVLLGGISSSVAPGPPPPRPAVDPGRPKAAEDYKKDLNVLVGALIAIAQDEDQRGETRLQAIFALGKINHPASLSFLLDHIDYRVSPQSSVPPLLPVNPDRFGNNGRHARVQSCVQPG